MATTYIQFTGRLKATSQEGIIAEAQQVAISSTDNTNVKTYIDNKIKEVQGSISSVAGSVYRPKGSLTVAKFKALTSAAVGDVYNITEQFTLSGRTYPAYTNVACVKAFSAAVTPDDSYWDALGGTVDLSPYAKTADVNTKVDTINKSISDNVSALETKISTAQNTANTANTTANTNKTNISGLTTRVSTLEGSDHVNKINTVKVNGTALTPDGNKAVNITIDKYTLPTASDTVLGGVKVGAVDDATISSYQGAKTTLRNGVLMCDLVSDSKNGALSKTDYAAFKKTGTDLAALDTRVTSAEDDINQLFSDKVDAVAGKGLSTNDFTAAYKTKLDGITAGANKYVLPAATASALGGVKVGKVYASGTILPTVATVNLRTSDNMAVVPAATTSAAGVMTASDKTKLEGIASTTRISPTDDIPVELGTGKSGFVVSDSGIYSYNEASGYIVYIGTHVDIKTGVSIGTRANIGEKAIIGDGAVVSSNVNLTGKLIVGTGVNIGDNATIGNDSHLCSNASLGTGIKLEVSNGNLLWGTVVLNQNNNLTALQNRVTALENLLKLA